MTDNSLPLRALLEPQWVELIETECEQGTERLLDWTGDSACGEEVLRIAALADYVCTCWPDSADDVHTAACHQINVVCWG